MFSLAMNEFKDQLDAAEKEKVTKHITSCIWVVDILPVGSTFFIKENRFLHPNSIHLPPPSNVLSPSIES
jgi:hypothetical protein